MGKVTDYKQNLNNAEATRILDVDPTVTPIDGFPGQLAVSYGDGFVVPKIWQKQDFGRTTNWVLLVGLNKNVLPDNNTPLSIDSLSAWYDLSENVESKIEFSTFPSIRTIKDQSLNNDVNRDLIQNNFSRQAIWTPAIQNGLGAANFTSDVYVLPSIITNAIGASDGDFTIFAVSKQSVSGNRYIISDNNQRTYIRYDSSGIVRYRFSVRGSNNARFDAVSTSDFLNSALRRDGTGFTDFLVDTPQSEGVGPQIANNDFFVGARSISANDPLNGYLAELIIYERALTDTEVQTILDYLKNKWNTI